MTEIPNFGNLKTKTMKFGKSATNAPLLCQENVL